MSHNTQDSRFKGLTDQEVLQVVKIWVNLLTPPKRPSIWKLYLEKFQDPVIKVLLVAAAFSLLISIIESEYAVDNRYIFCYFFGYRHWILF